MVERISFTRSSAGRIANVVRKVEGARNPGNALQFDPRVQQSSTPIKFAAFTGTSSWLVGTNKTVTLLQRPPDTAVNPVGVYVHASTSTAIAYSCLFSIPGNVATATQSTSLVAITKINGVWHVLAAIAN